VITPEHLRAAQVVSQRIRFDEKLVDYVLDLIQATRKPKEAGLADLVPLVQFGASPRATIALQQAARAHALLQGRPYVNAADVKAMAPDVLRHRVVLTYEAEADQLGPDDVIARILAAVPVP
jgi:MoxR-like ATPase